MKISIGKLKQAAVITGMTLSGIGGIGAITPANALTFTFTSAGAIDPLALAGFQQAGAFWSSLFTDNVSINIKIGYNALGTGVLAEAGSSEQSYTYSQVYNALNGDKTSADDTLAVSNLSNSSTFNMLLNRTSNNLGSATPYLDNNGNANNQYITMNTANAKALGLVVNPNDASYYAAVPTDSSYDAAITFSNQFQWDFNRSNGITAGTFDFEGIAAHEIGHALGFVSGVDVLDYYSSPGKGGPYLDSDFTNVSTLDLFRYSTLSTASVGGSVIDWTADARDKYFSLDHGVTKIASFATGSTFGDGRQASHWKDNLGLGIMDPTSAPGELLAITENDKRAFDAIGWNRAVVNNNATAVPEPSNLIGTFIFTAFGTKMVLKRRQKLSESSEK
jgi:hypothetical protein